MIRWIIKKKLDAVEKDIGASVDYLRHLSAVSLPLFSRFVRSVSPLNHLRLVPKPLLHVALLTTTKGEDCSTCVQIAVNLARKDGVPVEVLKSVLEGQADELPGELADAYHFAKELSSQSWTEGEYRERLRQKLGEKAFLELCLAMSTCRLFPFMKRSMGFAKSCHPVA